MTIADRWLLPTAWMSAAASGKPHGKLRRALLDLYHCWGYDQ